MTFKPCITKGEFSSEWNKANAVPVHTHTHTHTNTHTHTHRYTQIHTHTQHTRMQTHTHNAFEVRGVFIDASKAFEKVWHEHLILKLNQYRISENLFCLIKYFLKRLSAKSCS